MFVIGTAGHVDHGKSTLIKALTGIDPDRLREEKERQMTIDLGFAWLETPSGIEVGIVDVPGHRDFIDNMLAGAGGIDAVLFVIAADEGVMPQSKEHLSILNLLDVKQGIIVITKIDLVPDPEWLEFIKNDVKKLIAGTFLEKASFIEVSSKFGTGLKSLLLSIEELLNKCEPKRDIQKPRLPIDRVFSLKGFGTVVTGTTLDGQFSIGEQIEILPQKIHSRIREIQSHKRKLEVATPGSRTALNLTGVNVSEIERGNVIAHIGTFQSTQRIDVRFSLLKDAQNKLVHNDLVKFYTGTFQTLARVRVIGNESIQPDEKGWLQLEIKDPVALAKGDHFILRKPSPGETLGGGIILDEHPKKRSKRFLKNTIDHFNLLEHGTPELIIYSLFINGEPITIQTITEKTGFPLDTTVGIVAKLLGTELVRLDSQNENLSSNSIITTKNNWEQQSEKIINIISDFHIKFPLRQGILKDELRRLLDLSPRIFGLYIENLIQNEQLKEIKTIVYLPEHSIEFNNHDKQTANEIFASMEATPFSPPALNDLRTRFGSEIILALMSTGLLIQTSEDIAFRKQDFDSMKAGLEEFVKKEGSIALNQFRDLFHTSRKYALSFLEFLDKKGITTRDGDRRILRAIDKE